MLWIQNKLIQFKNNKQYTFFTYNENLDLLSQFPAFVILLSQFGLGLGLNGEVI